MLSPQFQIYQLEPGNEYANSKSNYNGNPFWSSYIFDMDNFLCNKNMIIISQRDSRWAYKTLGNSTSTVGKFGCCISAVSMSSSYFGCYKDPGFLAKYLKFTNTGLLIWSSITNVLCCKFLWRGYKYEQDKIDEALKNPNKTCLLNVDRGYHWVLGIKRIPLTKTFLTANPWTGTRMFYSGVEGYAILQRK